jgi:hypothetical protein
MGTIRTTSSVSHELALAAGFGGPMFGMLALDPALRQGPIYSDAGEQALPATWRAYRWVSGATLLVTGATWLGARLLGHGAGVGRRDKRLIIAKDVLIGGAVASGVASLVLASQIGKDAATAGRPSGRDLKLKRAADVLGYVNMACYGALIGVTTILGAPLSGRSWTRFAHRASH